MSRRTAIPPSPALPQAGGMIEGCHDADITPDTIIPPWYGERLDPDHAIYVCLANAANQARHPEQPEVQYDPEEEYEPFQPRMGGGVPARLDSQAGPRACSRLSGRPPEATRPARQPGAATRAPLP